MDEHQQEPTIDPLILFIFINMFNDPLEVPLITCKGSFSNGKLQASI